MKTVQRLQRVPFFVLRRLTPCHYIVPLLLALIVMGLPEIANAQQNCEPHGDVNMDGSVTAADALAAFRQALSIVQLSTCQRDIADVSPSPATPDGTITAADALCIFQKALGLSSCLDSVATLTATISGVVRNYETGEEIPGAAVRVTQYVDSLPRDLGNTTADDGGAYEIQVQGEPGRAGVKVAAEGFAPQSFIVYLSEDLADVPADIAMLPVQVITSFQPSQEEENTHFSVPANSLVTTTGAVPSGGITAMVTVLDASSDPSVMPGDFMSMDPGTETMAPIESFGAMTIEFMDGNEQPLNLGNGRTATIKIPLAERRDPGTAPPSMPLYYWSDAMSSWVEEGDAILQQDANGQWAYVGNINHFSTWNADIPYDTVVIEGCVTDIDRNPVASARVTVIGRDYIGSSSAITGSDGRFEVPARRNSEVLISAVSGSHSNTIIVPTGSVRERLGECLVLGEQEVGASIKLTWGENPLDLDSHLYGPAENGGTFHVFYQNQTVAVVDTVINLDVDDVDSYGPEIITVTDFPLPGTYEYFVHHYFGTSTISASPARVELNLGGETHIFSPVMASGFDNGYGAWWAVFRIEVDENFVPEVIPVQEFDECRADSAACYATAAGNNRALPMRN